VNSLQIQRIRSGVERPKNIMTEFDVAFRMRRDLLVVAKIESTITSQP